MFLVSFTFSWEIDTGIKESSCSTDTNWTGAVTGWAFFMPCLPLVHHGHLVIALYMHLVYLGGFMVMNLCGIISIKSRILSLLKVRWPIVVPSNQF